MTTLTLIIPVQKPLDNVETRTSIDCEKEINSLTPCDWSNFGEHQRTESYYSPIDPV
jgi:hypothetical protein